MITMKIHIIPTGFTPIVFTDSAGSIVREGADRIISLHEPYKDRWEKATVEETIKKVKETFRIDVEQRLVRSKEFTGIVQELKELLLKFSEDDLVFLHLGGGQRHLGIALVYASFFARKKNTVLVAAVEYGFEKGRGFRFEELLPLVPQRPTSAQKKVLNAVIKCKKVRLTGIITELGGEFSSKAPSVLRHLRNLEGMNLVRYDHEEKTYSPTNIAMLF